ncbi:vitamin K-dependent protein C-like [Drosophila kikkawai]|uniref:Vitamin K-dependent protein C-like n=1 Tax=Drosophila kikkawai TaxID=30033 RepID=A0ABM4GD19_DROKI
MFLYDECGGDDISLNMVVHIYGGKIPGKGVMITDRYVLTTAKDLPSDAGSLVVSISEDIVYEEVPVESIIKHPDFSGDHNHDIALLKLARPPSLSGKRKPICMLLQARHRQRAANSTNFTIFDSRASNATSLKVHLINSSECSTRIETEMEQDQLCIEEPEKEKEIKYGQAGDIMGIKTVYSDKDKFVLVGIVSYSLNGLIILTNVLEYTNWIAGIVTNE